MILFTLRELYVSSNGDKWEITEDDDKRLFIRHTPSEASGGRQGILTIESFLEPGLGGPEQEALKKLIADGDLFIDPARTKQYFARSAGKILRLP
jgi:hypothetical protein